MADRQRIRWTIAAMALPLTAAAFLVWLPPAPTPPPSPTPTLSPGPWDTGSTAISGRLDGQLIVCIVWRQRDGGIGSDCWEADAPAGQGGGA